MRKFTKYSIILTAIIVLSFCLIYYIVLKLKNIDLSFVPFMITNIILLVIFAIIDVIKFNDNNKAFSLFMKDLLIIIILMIIYIPFIIIQGFVWLLKNN